jgi:hypothetical protein
LHLVGVGIDRGASKGLNEALMIGQATLAQQLLSNNPLL